MTFCADYYMFPYLYLFAVLYLLSLSNRLVAMMCSKYHYQPANYIRWVTIFSTSLVSHDDDGDGERYYRWDGTGSFRSQSSFFLVQYRRLASLFSLQTNKVVQYVYIRQKTVF